MSIHIEKNPSEEKLVQMGVETWPIWEKEASQFPWFYDTQETCYILEGVIEVTPEGGKPVRIEAGNLVVFPAGLSCHWHIIEPVKKHYSFG